MPPAKKNDQYTNIVFSTVTMSAADTLTFNEVVMGLSLYQKVGLLIHRLEYSMESAGWNALVSNADIVQLAVTTSNNMSTISQDIRSVVDTMDFKAWASGTPANTLIANQPYVHDFTGLPGGGILIPPRPLYVGMDSAGIGSALDGYIRMFFTVQTLKDSEFFELLETFRYNE